MQKFFWVFFTALVLFSCSSDESSSTSGNFQYIVSGSSSADITGTNCRFGPSTGSTSFVTMVSGVDVLTFTILLDPLVPGSYAVNPIFVNGVLQPSEVGDSSGELQLGSVFSSSQKFFNTASGNGGHITITSIDNDILQGDFQASMLELVGGTAGSEPQINVAGNFTALKQ